MQKARLDCKIQCFGGSVTGLVGAEYTRLRTWESLVCVLMCWLTLVFNSPTRTSLAECSLDCTVSCLSYLPSRFPWLERAITSVLSSSFHTTGAVPSHINKCGLLILGPALNSKSDAPGSRSPCQGCTAAEAAIYKSKNIFPLRNPRNMQNNYPECISD